MAQGAAVPAHEHAPHPVLQRDGFVPLLACLRVGPVVSLARLEDLREGCGDVPGRIFSHHGLRVGQARRVHLGSIPQRRGPEALIDCPLPGVFAAGVEQLLLLLPQLLRVGLLLLASLLPLFLFLALGFGLVLLVAVLLQELLVVVGDHFLLRPLGVAAFWLPGAGVLHGLLLQSPELLHHAELVPEHSEGVALAFPGRHAHGGIGEPYRNRLVAEGGRVGAGHRLQLRQRARVLLRGLLQLGVLLTHGLRHELAEHRPGALLPRHLLFRPLPFRLLLLVQLVVEDNLHLHVQLQLQVFGRPLAQGLRVQEEVLALLHDGDLHAFGLCALLCVGVFQQVVPIDGHEAVLHEPIFLEGAVAALRFRASELVERAREALAAHHKRHPLLPVGVLREAPHEEDLRFTGF